MPSIWSQSVLVITPILAVIWAYLMIKHHRLQNNPRRIYPPPNDLGFLNNANSAKMDSEKVDWAKEGF